MTQNVGIVNKRILENGIALINQSVMTVVNLGIKKAVKLVRVLRKLLRKQIMQQTQKRMILMRILVCIVTIKRKLMKVRKRIRKLKVINVGQLTYMYS